MKTFKKINDITMKIARGMILIFAMKLTLILTVFTFQACSTDDISTSDIYNIEFNNALEISKTKLSDIKTFNTNGINSKLDYNNKTIYLLKDSEQDLTNTSFLNTINNLESLVQETNNNNLELSETYTLKEDEVVGTFAIQEESIHDALEPAIKEARRYLHGKGFTDQTINQMIIDEEGKEEDLVAFVMSLSELENSQNSNSFSFNDYSSFLFNSAYAQELTLAEAGTCAAIAIGADVLWALGGSSASSWTLPAMKKAFGAVAKRMLGPIGVAIAVVSFGICVLNESQD
ncbi:hypothetical protein [Psychroflexus sediminis]|uniref:Uncharacterized protein n=1 Tax=Psychroflexus sediminis TaxID=470826 RepID=A0A1G7U240_9FLAO|nr:hypothetical protein [Psychroflexus sediminis]SDG41109.1 hypothetical protein SAMN04488027_101178 [Psychroflexus sediminis]